MAADDTAPERSVDESLVATLASIMDLIQPIAEAVDGYRQQCVDRGYSAPDASTMAVDLHRQLIARMFT